MELIRTSTQRMQLEKQYHGMICLQCINSLATEKCECNFTSVFVKLILRIILRISCDFGFRWVPQNPCLWEFNIGSGNGLVPSGNKPLPEPILIKISVAIQAITP